MTDISSTLGSAGIGGAIGKAVFQPSEHLGAGAGGTARARGRLRPNECEARLTARGRGVPVGTPTFGTGNVREGSTPMPALSLLV
jgi:hypothetical protein